MAHITRKQTIILGLIGAATVLAVVGAVCYVVLRRAAINDYESCAQASGVILETYPPQCSIAGRTFTDTSKSLDDTFDTTPARAVESGNGLLSVVFPDGWSILRTTQGDDFALVTPHQTQPDILPGSPAKITDITNLAGDSPRVFVIVVGDNFAAPLGTASDFTIGKDESLNGKKYSYEYPADTEPGLGARLSGDRAYEYVFALDGGKELHIYYNVFGADPRNQIETIDQVVSSIRILQ